MPDPKVEEQNRQRVQVGLGGRIGLTADQFRGHIFERAPNLGPRLAVDADVIVIADENVATEWVEHSSCRGRCRGSNAGEVQGAVAVAA